jgi:YD repeat-containing protein
VDCGGYSANYTYLANSPVVSTVTYKLSTITSLTTIKQYDLLNRLQSIASHPGGTPSLASLSYSYQYNDANQRTRTTLADGSYWLYEYDTLGQVKTGKRYWPDHMPVAGQQFEYGFNDIGNRTSTKAGGDANGANLRSATYTPTLLNQYTSRTVPGSFDVLGIANANASVSVNSSAADYRRGEYFQESVNANNASAAVWQSISATANRPVQTLSRLQRAVPFCWRRELFNVWSRQQALPR